MALLKSNNCKVGKQMFYNTVSENKLEFNKNPNFKPLNIGILSRNRSYNDKQQVLTFIRILCLGTFKKFQIALAQPIFNLWKRILENS